MSLNGFSHYTLSFMLASTLGLCALPAGAASPCKGLDESACKGSEACRWIASYTTKNGNTVSAYCRSAGNKPKQDANVEGQEPKLPGSNDRADGGMGHPTSLLEERNG